MYFLSIDPGVYKAGVALWRLDPDEKADELVSAAVIKIQNEGDSGLPRAARMVGAISDWVGRQGGLGLDSLAVEYMQNDGRTSGAVTGDVLDVQVMAGACLWIMLGSWNPASVASYTPFQWKRNMSKGMAHARAAGRLTLEEKKALPTRLGHDAWDAIAIGGYHLRQLGYPRWQKKRGGSQ